MNTSLTWERFRTALIDTVISFQQLPKEIKKLIDFFSTIYLDWQTVLPILILVCFLIFIKRFDKKDVLWWISVVFIFLLILLLFSVRIR